jgi:hypothetical protein
MKNSNYVTRNGTRDLPACSAVPQPTAPPCAPFKIGGQVICNVKYADDLVLLAKAIVHN